MAVGCVVALSSCIVGTPPDFETPKTRPNFNLDTASPPLSQLLVVQTGDDIPLLVEFASEDDGEDIQWQLYLNWGLEGEDRLDQQIVPAGSLEDEDRAIRLTWTVGAIPNGCQQLTLLATHENNIPRGEPQRPKDGNDVAYAHWWVNVNPEIGQQQTLVNCPGVGISSD